MRQSNASNSAQSLSEVNPCHCAAQGLSEATRWLDKRRGAQYFKRSVSSRGSRSTSVSSRGSSSSTTTT